MFEPPRPLEPLRPREPSRPGAPAGSDLNGLFPSPGELPAEWVRPPDETGLRLLVGGRVTRWDGPSSPIRSAVCVRAADGGLEQVDLGPGALASAEMGLQALGAADRAWAGGRC